MLVLTSHFNYQEIWQDHLSALAYGLCVVSMVSLYFTKNYFLRGVVFLLALFLGWYAGRLEWFIVPFIVLYATIFYYGENEPSKAWRGLYFFLSIIMTVVLMAFNVPGFYPWQLTPIQLSPQAATYSLTLYFDKFLTGLFFLWFSTLSLVNDGKWRACLKVSMTTMLAALIVLIGMSYYLGYGKLELKFTNFFWIWAIHNLFFTCSAEEVLFRGMILRFLLLHCQHWFLGKWLALVISASLFGAAHFAGGVDYMLLAATAGLFYGYAFMKTKKIEASILTHWGVNLVHFVAFTYPSFQ